MDALSYFFLVEEWASHALLKEFVHLFHNGLQAVLVFIHVAKMTKLNFRSYVLHSDMYFVHKLHQYVLCLELNSLVNETLLEEINYYLGSLSLFFFVWPDRPNWKSNKFG